MQPGNDWWCALMIEIHVPWWKPLYSSFTVHRWGLLPLCSLIDNEIKACSLNKGDIRGFDLVSFASSMCLLEVPIKLWVWGLAVKFFSYFTYLLASWFYQEKLCLFYRYQKDMKHLPLTLDIRLLCFAWNYSFISTI